MKKNKHCKYRTPILFWTRYGHGFQVLKSCQTDGFWPHSNFRGPDGLSSKRCGPKGTL